MVQVAGLSQTRWHRFMAGLFAGDKCKEVGRKYTTADVVDSTFMQSYERVTALLADVSAFVAVRQFDEARWALVQLRNDLNDMRVQTTDLAGLLDDYKQADAEAKDGDENKAEELATRTALAQSINRLRHRLDAAQYRWDQKMMADSVLFAMLELFAHQRGLKGPENTQDPEAWAVWFSQLPAGV